MTYIDSIDLRRIWIVDEEQGLVFAYSMFRHPMEKKSIDDPEQGRHRFQSGR